MIGKNKKEREREKMVKSILGVMVDTVNFFIKYCFPDQQVLINISVGI